MGKQSDLHLVLFPEPTPYIETCEGEGALPLLRCINLGVGSGHETTAKVHRMFQCTT